MSKAIISYLSLFVGGLAAPKAPGGGGGGGASGDASGGCRVQGDNLRSHLNHGASLSLFHSSTQPSLSPLLRCLLWTPIISNSPFPSLCLVLACSVCNTRLDAPVLCPPLPSPLLASLFSEGFSDLGTLASQAPDTKTQPRTILLSAVGES